MTEVLDSGVAAPTSRESSRCWTFMPLHGKHGEGKFTLLDHKDFEQFGDKNYSVCKGYANRFTRTGGRSQPLHKVSLARQILGLEHGDPREADHINRDKLDNRRSNLRITDRQGNLQNFPSRAGSSSRFRGVSFISDPRSHRKPWRAQVCVDYKQHYLGDFATEEEAAEVARAFRAEHMKCATD